MNVLENPDPRRYRETRVFWGDLFAEIWPDGIPCLHERSNNRWLVSPLFTREIAEQLVVFYNEQHRSGDGATYEWAGERLLIFYPSDELDSEDNGEREFSTIEEVDPVDGIYHLDHGMIWDEHRYVDHEVEALRHQDAAVARGNAIALRKQMVRRCQPARAAV